MTEHIIVFNKDEINGESITVSVLTGTLLSDAAFQAGCEIGQPCGGQGRCGRCLVQVIKGNVRRRSALRLTEEDVSNGYALACQSIIEGDAEILIPQQEKIERRLTTDKSVVDVSIPIGYSFSSSQNIRLVHLKLPPPSMDDQTDDWSRLQAAFRLQSEYKKIKCSISVLRILGTTLREGNWSVTGIIDISDQDSGSPVQLIHLIPGITEITDPLWSLAIDIGTTTVTVWLVDLISGSVVFRASEYNGQISRGEDVISRIVYASKESGGVDLQARVIETINKLVIVVCKRAGINSNQIIKAVIAGNSTMIHLLLEIPPSSIRFSPFITVVNHPMQISAKEIGLKLCPAAVVDCLPGIASYVGADITAGVLSSGMYATEKLTLFLDVGTNGEIVLGNQDWLVSCACSAGPAFEGAGVVDGMRATEGAIEEVWVNTTTYEPTVRIIGGGKPKGICGSGLISLLAELFLAGLIDKAGNVNTSLDTPRVREGDRGGEYILAWAEETVSGKDITITRVDIDNLLRAKAAIYAGFTVLAEQVGVLLEDVEQILIGGSFGKYINIEKAIQIGLLPDVPWDHYKFLGNTSILGAYKALLSSEARQKVEDIANNMTYIELSADNTFYEAFMSAMFLPHTDLNRFPTVKAALNLI
ncbi:MAG: ASKHA domain-containing protein [Chloroflexota bacterium]